MASNIIKKLSMRHLVGNVQKFIPTKEITEKRGDKTVVKDVPAIGETVWIAQIVGIARGIKGGVSNFGDWEALVGDFIAVPLVGDKAAQPAGKDATGKVIPAKDAQRFRSGQIFLPEVVMNMVASAIGNNSGVDFAFKIGITAVPTDGERPSATGYEYTADFLIEPEASDPLTALAEKALGANEEKNETENNA